MTAGVVTLPSNSSCHRIHMINVFTWMENFSTLPHTHLIHNSLDDVHQTEQDGMEAEEDIIGTDRVNSIRIHLQKLLLQGDNTAT